MNLRTAGALISMTWLAGCGPEPAGIAEPPQTLGGGAWTRQAVERPAVESVPRDVKLFRPKQWLRTEYRRAASSVRLNVFRMPGEPSAFEARQKWLGQSGAASMNHGSLFVVAETATESPQALGQFLRLLEEEWLSAQPR